MKLGGKKMNNLQQIELDEIEEFIQSEYSTEEIKAEIKQRFQITDLNSLNWALRKLSALDTQQKEIAELRSAEIGRIEQWFQSQTSGIERSREFFEYLISEYAQAQREVDPKWKAKTPYGAVGFRKQQPEWVYAEDDSLTKYLIGSEWEKNYTRTKIEPNKAEIKKSQIFKAQNGKLINTVTGEVVPGVEIIEREEKITIKVEG